MPPALKEQLRYPKDLFTAQMSIYARYHQTTPELFYEQAETWDFARVHDTLMKPFYFTTALEGYRSDQQSFILINPMTPVGRANLSVLAVAGTPTLGNVEPGKGYSQQIVLYRFSREVQADGPAQVSALIDQDPEIARQFALWDQRAPMYCGGGSSCCRWGGRCCTCSRSTSYRPGAPGFPSCNASFCRWATWWSWTPRWRAASPSWSNGFGKSDGSNPLRRRPRRPRHSSPCSPQGRSGSGPMGLLPPPPCASARR